ncbi:MAG: S-methyl-5-thioribose-1-phosphate isomerase, partial [Dehalococcoidia bacterium]|nr:S-methyl-5-thioribose-1-phosphate isomerase [Dehalococcoidia bacterium]
MKTIEWLGNRLKIIDQTKLPETTAFVELFHYHEVVTAIREMTVRGAPAIGVAAAYGIALGAQSIKAENKTKFLSQFDEILHAFSAARPTAANLFRTIDRMKTVATTTDDIPGVKQALIDEAKRIHAEEEAATERISQLGAELIEDGFTILTHCNAGSLATAGYGTALGVIKAAKEQGKQIDVIATETRPLLQGARLTAWELMQENIPTTLITDSMAGYFMSRGKVNCVIVGADRIAANGDTANKIGTYTLAVLAAENGVPFYVAAPTSTIDLSLSSGEEIPIEERSPEEVTSIGGVSLAPKGVTAANPAFDVTPHYHII